jgi:hypothetical protein
MNSFIFVVQVHSDCWLTLYTAAPYSQITYASDKTEIFLLPFCVTLVFNTTDTANYLVLVLCFLHQT